MNAPRGVTASWPGLRNQTLLSSTTWRLLAGLTIFVVLAIPKATTLASSDFDRPWALAVLIVVPLAVAFIRRPIIAGSVIAACSLLLQLAHIGWGYADQHDLSRAAWSVAIRGESPYGVAVQDGGMMYSYGPLAMVTAHGGVVLEWIAAAGILALLIHARAWVALGVVAGLPPFVGLAMSGVNDYVPGFLVTAGLLGLLWRPRWGVVLLALAAAVKPYALAWFLPAIGFAGLSAAAWLVTASVVLWSPVLLWGLPAWLSSMRYVWGVADGAPGPTNSLGVPWLRWLGPPISTLGLLVRRWEYAVLLGSGGFVFAMFSGTWASLGYWIVVVPITGIAIERIIQARLTTPLPALRSARPVSPRPTR